MTTQPLSEKLIAEFEEIGFGNQARIVGTKRKELVPWLKEAFERVALEERERCIKEIGLQKIIPVSPSVAGHNQGLRTAIRAIERLNQDKT